MHPADTRRVLPLLPALGVPLSSGGYESLGAFSELLIDRPGSPLLVLVGQRFPPIDTILMKKEQNDENELNRANEIPKIIPETLCIIGVEQVVEVEV